MPHDGQWTTDKDVVEHLRRVWNVSGKLVKYHDDQLAGYYWEFMRIAPHHVGFLEWINGRIV